MSEIKALNDKELEKVNGCEIESANVVGYNDMSPLKCCDQLNNLNRQHEEYEDG